MTMHLWGWCSRSSCVRAMSTMNRSMSEHWSAKSVVPTHGVAVDRWLKSITLASWLFLNEKFITWASCLFHHVGSGPWSKSVLMKLITLAPCLLLNEIHNDHRFLILMKLITVASQHRALIKNFLVKSITLASLVFLNETDNVGVPFAVLHAHAFPNKTCENST